MTSTSRSSKFRSARFVIFAAGLAGAALFATLRASAARPLAPQDTLERLARIGKYELLDWRFRRGEESRGGSINLDDSQWKEANPGHSWNGENTEGWYRKMIEIPAKLAGFSIIGSPVTLEVGIDDYGEIWVDGEKKADFQWDQGSVILTKSAEPGKKFFVAIRGRNRGGPGRLLHARLVFGALSSVQASVSQLSEKLGIAKKVIEVFGDNAQKWNAILDRAGARVDFAAAERGDEKTLVASFEKAGAELSELKELTKDYKIRCAGYSHIDLAWLWRWKESVQVTKETFASALNFIKEYPDFRFSMSQSHAYRWMEEKYPDLFVAMKKAIADGTWEIVGGTAVELDCNLPDAESQIRQIVYGQRYFQQKFGKRTKIGWCPDSFGYNANLPQILKKSGMDYFVTAKISWNDTNKFPHNLFWWEAPDGSRVLTFLPMGGYTNDLAAEPMLEYAKEVEQQTGYKEILMVYGVGNHGGGPTREMIEREKRLESIDFYPKIEKSTAIDYFEKIPNEAREKLPNWKDELYLEYHRGTYTTQAANKRANRKGEIGIVTAEKLASLAVLYGEPYPYKELEQAWDYLLFNQMHDILPGSSITPVYRDSSEDYTKMFAIVDRIIQKSASAFPFPNVANLNVAPFIVFNPLSWSRGSAVELDTLESFESFRVTDVEGKPVPSQVVKNSAGKKTVIFVPPAVAPLAAALLLLEPIKNAPGEKFPADMPLKTSTDPSNGNITIENQFIQLTVDKKTGNINSMIHKPSKREVFAGPGNRLQLLEDKPKQYDAWELGFTGKQWDLDTAASVEITEFGPVRTTVKITKTFLGDTKAKRKPTEDFPSSFFTQEISLYDNIPWAEVRLNADWWEDHICAKVEFPLSVKSDKATFEVPHAVLERSTKRDTPWEKARYEVPAQKFADVTEGNFGVSIINESKYGYDILNNVLRLTCFRAPMSPDPTADRGRHEFKYAIYPHEGDWRSGGTVRAAYEFNTPMVTSESSFTSDWGGPSFAHFSQMGIPRVQPGVGGSTDPLTEKDTNRFQSYPKAPSAATFTRNANDPIEGRSLVACDATNIIVNVVKWADAEDAMIVRFYEAHGAPKTKVTLKFPFEIESAARVNLLEEEPSPFAPSGNSLTIETGPFSIETVKIKPRRK